MGWTSYYVGSQSSKDCAMEELESYARGGNNVIKRTVWKGSKLYALLHSTRTDDDWVLLLLTSKKDGEFYYKDIQCNPYESGVPMSILKDFIPKDKENAEWKEKSIAENKRQKARLNEFEVGDYIKCVHGNYSTCWGNYFKLEPNEVFYLKCTYLNPYAKRKKKTYVVSKLGEYGFSDTRYRLRDSSFNSIPQKEKVTKAFLADLEAKRKALFLKEVL